LIPKNNKLIDINVSGSEAELSYFNGKVKDLKEKNYQYITIPYKYKLREVIIE